MLVPITFRFLFLLSTTATLANARPLAAKTQSVSESPLTYIGQKCKQRKDFDRLITEDDVILNEIRLQSEITQKLGRLHVEKYFKQGSGSLSGQNLAQAWVLYMALCRENWETFRLDISAWKQWTKDSLNDIGNTGRGFYSKLRDNFAGLNFGPREDGGSHAENTAEPPFRMIQEMTMPIIYVLLMLISVYCLPRKFLMACNTAKTTKVLLKGDLYDEDLLIGDPDFEVISIPHCNQDNDPTTELEGYGEKNLGFNDNYHRQSDRLLISDPILLTAPGGAEKNS